MHELLAVESNLSDQADARRKETISNTFEKKKTHFAKKIVTFFPLREGADPVTEEQLGMQTTVPQEIKWLSSHLERALDAAYQIDEANTKARADVVLDDGSTLLKDVPATQLLQLQKRVQEIKEFVLAIPTLDPSKGFEKDENEGKNVYKARLVVKTRTQKTRVKFVKYDATDKHPAQVDVYDDDLPTGSIQTQEWSGFITVTDKSEMLDRVEELARAVKKARARANEVEVDVKGLKIAGTLLNHVFGKVTA